MTLIEEFILYVQRVYLDMSERSPGAISPQAYADLMRALRSLNEKVHAGQSG